MTWGNAVLPLVAAVPLVLAACSTSAESLAGAVEDKPGVVKVRVEEYDGDDLVPGTRIPKDVTILMSADATAAQITNVFAELDGDVDDGDVGSIEVVLDDPERVTLALGEGIHATDTMVDELVEARDDDAIVEYRREAYPVLPGVYVTLGSGDFDQVVAVADRYRDADEIDYVYVVAGDFDLSRDEVNADPTLTSARERFVETVSGRFRLTGASVSGRSPVELVAAPADRAALLAYVEANAPKSLGRVVVSDG